MLFSASDSVGAVLHSALDGLAYRQRVAANNVANMDTPGFTASSVDFEDSLKTAIDDGSVTEGGASPETSLSTRQAGADGNNVDLASETMTQMQATFAYQLLSRAVGDRYGMVTTAIGGM